MDNFMPQKLDILLTGVGGQGVVLAGDVLGDLGISAGYDVKKSDTLGMAQRGGSVVAHVRMGSDVASPLIPKGEADLLLSFEKLETIRWADHIRAGAVVLYNDQKIPPLSVSRGEATYPSDEQIVLALSSRTTDIFAVPGDVLTLGLGNPKVLNVIMLGALSMFLPFSPDAWIKTITSRVPEKVVEINSEAFTIGRKEMRRQMMEMAIQDEREYLEGVSEHDDSCEC
ncbi:MAG: indolepyruvate oxidoreductase subunit beta [Dehalococcoidia bacterium]|nr:indolepyruvate oxidoreductase subunit beta [Dehalococcoidia bacterium]